MDSVHNHAANSNEYQVAENGILPCTNSPGERAQIWGNASSIQAKEDSVQNKQMLLVGRNKKENWQTAIWWCLPETLWPEVLKSISREVWFKELPGTGREEIDQACVTTRQAIGVK